MKVENSDKLSELHDLIADKFLDILKKDEPPTAAELGVMIKFLKDNGIESAPVEGAKTTKIAKILPFPDGQLEASG